LLRDDQRNAEDFKEKKASPITAPDFDDPEKKEAVSDLEDLFQDTDPSLNASGYLELHPDGYGFLRTAENGLSGEDDVYVSPTQIRRFDLRNGDFVCGNVHDNDKSRKNANLIYVSTINGLLPTESRKRPKFEELTPIFPCERIHLEEKGSSTAMRVVDLLSPIGKGQRGMIVAPPKAGKTTLLKDVARSILHQHPEMQIFILLIDERPEEVTDIKESIPGEQVEVISSTFDELPEHHRRVAEITIERAKRMVELKKDVIILVDSITRLTRAYNQIVPPSGRTLSGGLDPAALHMPKRFFGAARNLREGGSLTILATALVDTGSKMDDVVYEEFKGTGNMELVLDRKLQERRIFPAIDLTKSGTRREDLLLNASELEAVEIIHRGLNGMRAEEAAEQLLTLFARTKTNEDLMKEICKGRMF
jgi:transcription termination factor Rho